MDQDSTEAEGEVWAGLAGVPSGAVLVGLLVLCFGVAAVGGISTADAVQTWYPTLNKPPWTPPNAAFGPIWTFLYAAMAVAIWDVVRRPAARKPVREAGMFGLQLLLNALWSPLFFAWHQVGLALAVIAGLWLCIAVCIGIFWRSSRLAAVLMALYLLWISIASSINAWVWLHPV